MKIDAAVNEVVLSNVGATGEFKIRNSAKAFKILSDGLYSNKIRAIIRELSCNAVDSHVGAGKADVPFEVHLPTVLEPWFSVRDFGLGLDNDQVVNIYTTYFESTKTDSNAFIGALGLGSKSPFSYTENFTITAIKNGVQRIYSAFINEQGVPSIAEMGEQLTDEGNGVEVKFSVTDKSDYQSFRTEAYGVFSWFKNKPIITGHPFEHKNIVYKEANIVPGVHLIETDYNHHCTALMGNIPYPLNNIPDVEKHFGNLSHLLSCGLVFEFEIGELDFAASREQLSYIPLTISSIRKKLELLNANLESHLAAKANAIENKWERAEYLYAEHQSRLYKSAVIAYANNTKFELFDPKAYYGKKTFKYNVPDLEKRGLEIKAFRASHRGTERIGRGREYINTGYVETIDIPVEGDVVFVLNDLKTGCVARARYHYSRVPGRQSVYCVSHTATDVATRQKEYDAFLKELSDPPTVVLASSLQKAERRTPMSTTGIATIGVKEDKRSGYVDAYKWVPYTQVIDENRMYYYVALSNHTPIDSEGREFPMFEIKALMDGCGISDISGIEVFGVRKSRIKELEELDNWVWIEDKLKEETAKITDEHIASLVATEMLDSYYNKVYTSTKVAKAVGSNSDYAKYVEKYSKIKRAAGNVTELVALCGKYGKSLYVDKVKKGIEDAKKALYAKYTALPHIASNAPESVFIEYIKLVDKQ
jgi:hypothetical protein